ncbi:MAG: hypothetical protein F4138_07860 [Acidimicrobiia bacterium]|nr:hypothetical protein [Acidimicrobiia bacterium]MYC57586.1 hypothetical protein [Acidimicrobiia bacterium]MYG94876.1 hypothetical protein [Acidimicrobiia bacterium]MYI31283.1 hypothetical protein [Acidimicrobiia bacterium]
MDYLQITPQPTEAEVAAIVAAYQALMAQSDAPTPSFQHPTNKWRFSGRWWMHSPRPGSWRLP